MIVKMMIIGINSKKKELLKEKQNKNVLMKVMKIKKKNL